MPLYSWIFISVKRMLPYTLFHPKSTFAASLLKPKCFLRLTGDCISVSWEFYVIHMDYETGQTSFIEESNFFFFFLLLYIDLWSLYEFICVRKMCSLNLVGEYKKDWHRNEYGNFDFRRSCSKVRHFIFSCFIFCSLLVLRIIQWDTIF